MEWQPIESIPKPDVGLLLLVTDGEQVTPAETWTDGTKRGLYDLAKWNYDGNDDIAFVPTHWMPLPVPPNTKAPDRSEALERKR